MENFNYSKILIQKFFIDFQIEYQNLYILIISQLVEQTYLKQLNFYHYF
jgi:hypothetical protein